MTNSLKPGFIIGLSRNFLLKKFATNTVGLLASEQIPDSSSELTGYLRGINDGGQIATGVAITSLIDIRTGGGGSTAIAITALAIYCNDSRFKAAMTTLLGHTKLDEFAPTYFSVGLTLDTIIEYCIQKQNVVAKAAVKFYYDIVVGIIWSLLIEDDFSMINHFLYPITDMFADEDLDYIRGDIKENYYPHEVSLLPGKNASTDPPVCRQQF